MKILIVSITILLVSVQVFGQKKSKEDAKDVQIAALTRQLDSLSKELVKYTGVYDTLKKKVIHYNFDPGKTSFLIDSLSSLRGSSSMLLTNAYTDSIAVLKKENLAMKTTINFANSDAEKAKLFMTQEEIDKAKVVGILKQYKDLLDNKVITDAEFLVLKKKYLEKL